MRSNRWSLCVWIAPLLLSASCGLLGQRTDVSKMLQYSPESVGCMNEVGPRVQAYYRGEITPEAWDATWDCGVNSLGLFKKFVRSSHPDGYTRDDLRALISKFMLTNAPVTPELIAATFELKASVFGGSSEILTRAEIDTIIRFLQVGKVESGRLLPYLVNRAREPSPDHLLALAEALVVAGEAVAASLNTSGNPMFSWTSAEVFANEIAKMMHLDLPPDAVAWLSAVKVLFAAGTRDGIEAEAWPRVLRAAVAYGGPAIAAFSVEQKYLNGPNAAGEFGMKLAWKVKASLAQTLQLYGGALPLRTLDQVLDEIPDKWVSVDKGVIKRALRPLAKRVLRSRVPDAIDLSAVDLVFAKLDFWVRGQTHLEKIFDRLDAGSTGVSVDRFTEAASRYADGLTRQQKTDVYRLILLARQIRPLFLPGDSQITFTPIQNQSLANLSQFHWIRIAAEHLLQSYSSVPGGMKGTVEDLKKIVDDFSEMGKAFGALDPTIPDLHVKRFREANLFTFSSNGDKFIDSDEATYYIAFLFSSGVLSARIRTGTDAVCPSLGKDILKNNWKDATCFRREFFSNFRTYADHFPLLVRFYESLSASRKEQFQIALESSARRYGYSSQPVASVDTDGYAGIMHYVEAIFARYDDDSSQIINLTEIMRAYPVFKLSLAELGGLDPSKDFLLEAAFTYTVKHGAPPTTDFWGIVKLGAWIAGKPFWKINADRLALYKVISSISVPEPIPTSSTPPKPKVFDSEALDDFVRAHRAGTLPAHLMTPTENADESE